MAKKNKWIYGGLAVALIVAMSGTDEEVQNEWSRPTVRQHTAPAAVGRVLGEMQAVGTSTPSDDAEPLVVTKESTATAEEIIYYPVVKVIDGDTLSIDKDGVQTTLRLIGLDTPETVHPSKPVECFGREASQKAKELLSGKKVRIETDSSQGLLDKYGRLLAYVFLPDGANFNKHMIERGYGYEYTYDLPYTYQEEFRAAEQEARENGRGLWAPGVCTAEEEGAATVPTPPDGIIQVTSSEDFVCSRNAYNCSDFSTRSKAQAVFNGCGGVNNDIHKLDRDSDGVVCEGLK